MDINYLSEFQLWLEDLSSGEISLYSVLLAGFISLLINKLSSSKGRSQNQAKHGSVAARHIQDSPIQIINIKDVKAKQGGIAIGVDTQQNSNSQQGDSDDQ